MAISRACGLIVIFLTGFSSFSALADDAKATSAEFRFQCLSLLHEKGFLGGVYTPQKALVLPNTAIPPEGLWIITPAQFVRATLPEKSRRDEILGNTTVSYFEVVFSAPNKERFPVEAQLSKSNTPQIKPTPTFGFAFDITTLKPLSIMSLKSIPDAKDLTPLSTEELSPGAVEIFSTLVEGSFDQIKEKYLEERAKIPSRNFSKDNEALINTFEAPLSACQKVPEFKKQASELLRFLKESKSEKVQQH